MVRYLVIGISTYDGVRCINEEVSAISPDNKFVFLNALQGRAPGIDFDRILVVKNGDFCPEVVNDFNIEDE